MRGCGRIGLRIHDVEARAKGMNGTDGSTMSQNRHTSANIVEGQIGCGKMPHLLWPNAKVYSHLTNWQPDRALIWGHLRKRFDRTAGVHWSAWRD